MDGFWIYVIFRDMISFLFYVIVSLRLTIPVLYALVMAFAFGDFTKQHETLVLVIFFVLVGLVALSWVFTFFCKVREIIYQLKHDSYSD